MYLKSKNICTVIHCLPFFTVLPLYFLHLLIAPIKCSEIIVNLKRTGLLYVPSAVYSFSMCLNSTVIPFFIYVFAVLLNLNLSKRAQSCILKGTGVGFRFFHGCFVQNVQFFAGYIFCLEIFASVAFLFCRNTIKAFEINPWDFLSALKTAAVYLKKRNNT